MQFYWHLMQDCDLRSPKIPQKGHKLDQLYSRLFCLSYFSSYWLWAYFSWKFNSNILKYVARIQITFALSTARSHSFDKFFTKSLNRVIFIMIQLITQLKAWAKPVINLYRRKEEKKRKLWDQLPGHELSWRPGWLIEIDWLIDDWLIDVYLVKSTHTYMYVLGDISFFTLKNPIRSYFFLNSHPLCKCDRRSVNHRHICAMEPLPPWYHENTENSVCIFLFKK